MALYAIGDLHLSFAADKPMDVFGGGWKGYQQKLESSLSRLSAEDTLVLLGDTSWGIDLQEADADFSFLHRVCSAQMVLLKGNHDYWWNTVGKMKKFFQEKGYDRFAFLHNSCVLAGETALCGTRGWFIEEERPGDPQNTKVFLREMGRLETSLRLGAESGAKKLVACLHYPPLYEGYRCGRVIELLEQYGVTTCLYGHLHGPGISRAIRGYQGAIDYKLLSADAVSFEPVKISE